MAPRWDEHDWPFDRGTVRLLPVVHARLECARAVAAHLDAFDPDVVVVEIPRAAGEAWRRAVAALPALSAVSLSLGGAQHWLIPQPADACVEAARWAAARGREVICADLAVPDYAPHADRLPDVTALPAIGYRTFVEAVLAMPPFAPDAHDPDREAELADAARRAAAGGRRVALVAGLAHAAGILAALERGAARRLTRGVSAEAGVMPLAADSLAEVWGDAPFLQAAWERARTGGPAATRRPPEGAARPMAEVRRFPGVAAEAPPDPFAIDEREEDAAAARGDDLLARERLIYRLVVLAARETRSAGGAGPSRAERGVLHRFARNMALLEGRLVPDLYGLVVAARGAVDDRFARDLLRFATQWPWAADPAVGRRLGAADLGLASRWIRLRPRIDRVARRRNLADALRRAWEAGPGGICSHQPEDLVVEALGREAAQAGRTRAARAGVTLRPFTASLLDGLDARETLRRYVDDGRPWVREEIAARAQAGAVVVLFDDAGEHPWCEVWYGEHENESDMAFFATDPNPEQVAPGIHRAEYGGFMLTWPPLRLGDIWHDPAYDFCRGDGERLVAAAIDYSLEPLVVVVAPRAPRAELFAFARRRGRKVVHLRPGIFPPERLRRLRTFHVLATRALRPVAEVLIDPTV